MISDKQLYANQENSLLGGVKTDEGKAISRYNARKHSILSQSFTDYDETEDYKDFVDELVDKYGSGNGLLGRMIEQAGICYIQLTRANKAETEYIKAALNPRQIKLKGSEGLTLDDVVVVNEGYVPKVSSLEVEKLMSIYCRYQTTLENRLLRLIKAIEYLSGNPGMGVN